MSFCFEALESAKISLCEPVSSQKYENGYRTKICDFTLCGVLAQLVTALDPSLYTTKCGVLAELFTALDPSLQSTVYGEE